MLSVDMDPSASGIQSCRSVSVGDTFDVAVVIEDVANLMGFQFDFLYDPALVNVRGGDVNLFLASPPGASILDLSDPLPDSDGLHVVGAMNVGPPPDANGSGVLARLTLSPVGAGAESLALNRVWLGDTWGDPMNMRWWTNGLVAVDQPCP